MSSPVIDGYCHCGINKYRPIEGVNRVLDRFGVSRAVLVQHIGEYDNSYIESAVRENPDRLAGVLMVDADKPGAEDALAAWAGGGVFRGVRLFARTLATAPGVWTRAAELGLNLVIFEDPTFSPYTDALADFAQRFPETPMIVSHLGMPRDPADFPSHQRVLSLAEQPNVYVQISGMHMFSCSPYADLVPLVERLRGAFGPERLFYGSNFPVMGEETVYGLELELLRAGRLGIRADEVGRVLSDTARTLWFAG
jgi:L-fuconolactonase